MQATMTVRTDAKLKAEFTKLCEEFGMSANTAFNVFMRAVMDTQRIPFTVGRRKDVRKRLGDALQSAHQDAVRRNEPELTIEEIDAEIAVYRAERQAKAEGARV